MSTEQAEEIARLRAILEPFAKAAENWRAHRDEVAILGRSGLKVAHFRLAAAAFPPEPTPPGPQPDLFALAAE
jgi:hypothetical protein